VRDCELGVLRVEQVLRRRGRGQRCGQRLRLGQFCGGDLERDQVISQRAGRPEQQHQLRPVRGLVCVSYGVPCRRLRCRTLERQDVVAGADPHQGWPERRFVSIKVNVRGGRGGLGAQPRSAARDALVRLRQVLWPMGTAIPACVLGTFLETAGAGETSGGVVAWWQRRRDDWRDTDAAGLERACRSRRCHCRGCVRSRWGPLARWREASGFQRHE
jgi:hypothetical protein